MCLLSRFWWKWFCLFFSMLLRDFRVWLLVLVMGWLWWLLLNRVLMVFCSMCFLLLMMILGVLRLIRWWRWLLWLIMWWYRLFRLLVVKWLLLSCIIGWSFGGMIGMMFRIIVVGFMLVLRNELMILRCLIVWILCWFLFFEICRCRFLVLVLRLNVVRWCWIDLVFM